jgi:hypothetical protein
MTDVTEQTETEAPAEQAAPTEAPAEAKAPKGKQPHDCLCQSFEVADPKDEDSVFTTGCEQTTKSVFAQGHDARLVSFLVDGHFDGYAIRQVVDGVAQTFPTPADAVAKVSTPLRDKALKATENREARDKAKKDAADAREAKKAEAKAAKEKAAADKAAAKEAAKTDGPKATGAEVVAGSEEGDTTPLAEGEVKIKVGRWTYNATIDDEGNANYTDGSGEAQVRAPGVFQLV